MKMDAYKILSEPVFEDLSAMTYDSLVEKFLDSPDWRVQESSIFGVVVSSDRWPNLLIDIDKATHGRSAQIRVYLPRHPSFYQFLAG